MRTQDRLLDMSRTCPQNPPKSWTFSEKSLSIILYIFQCACLVCEVLYCSKMHKKGKIQDFLDNGWYTGGCMHKGSIILEFKCPDRTRCLDDLRTLCHVQDISRIFPTKLILLTSSVSVCFANRKSFTSW